VRFGARGKAAHRLVAFRDCFLVVFSSREVEDHFA